VRDSPSGSSCQSRIGHLLELHHRFSTPLLAGWIAAGQLEVNEISISFQSTDSKPLVCRR
jgi:hypothetical protein